MVIVQRTVVPVKHNTTLYNQHSIQYYVTELCRKTLNYIIQFAFQVKKKVYLIESNNFPNFCMVISEQKIYNILSNKNIHLPIHFSYTKPINRYIMQNKNSELFKINH